MQEKNVFNKSLLFIDSGTESQQISKDGTILNNDETNNVSTQETDEQENQEDEENPTLSNVKKYQQIKYTSDFINLTGDLANSTADQTADRISSLRSVELSS